MKTSISLFFSLFFLIFAGSAFADHHGLNHSAPAAQPAAMSELTHHHDCCPKDGKASKASEGTMCPKDAKACKDCPKDCCKDGCKDCCKDGICPKKDGHHGH